MFQFPRFPLPSLCVQLGVPGYDSRGVAPFGHPRIIACPRLPEAFRCLATSFIGPRCQGIHRVPFARIRLLSPVPQNQHSTTNASPYLSSLHQHLHHHRSLLRRQEPSHICPCVFPRTPYWRTPDTSQMHVPLLQRALRVPRLLRSHSPRASRRRAHTSQLALPFHAEMLATGAMPLPTEV
jgi:hypothetical protein